MISPESAQLFYDLLQSPAFQRAIAEVIEDQKLDLVQYMRGCVSNDNLGLAQQTEGYIRALEELPGKLIKYAESAMPDRS